MILRLTRVPLALAALLAAAHALAAGPSTSVVVSGAVDHPTSYTAATLNALPQVTQTDTFASGATPQTHTYTGPTIWNAVNAAGVQTTPGAKNDILDRYVPATGTDGYRVVYSMGEIDPAFGNQPDRVAYEADGQMPASTGFARLVVPGDAKAGRYVSNLINLQVFTASPVPEPTDVAMLLAGLAGLGAFARATRRTR